MHYESFIPVDDRPVLMTVLQDPKDPVTYQVGDLFFDSRDTVKVHDMKSIFKKLTHTSLKGNKILVTDAVKILFYKNSFVITIEAENVWLTPIGKILYFGEFDCLTESSSITETICSFALRLHKYVRQENLDLVDKTLKTMKGRLYRDPVENKYRGIGVRSFLRGLLSHS